MQIFCPDCRAVFYSESLLEGCENLLCNGEPLVIDDDNFELLQSMIASCCHLNISKHVNLLGSIYFFELQFIFCDPEKARKLYAKAETITSKDEHEMIATVYRDPEEEHVFSLELIGGIYDFLLLDDMEKVQVIFKFKEILQEIFLNGDPAESTS